MGHIFAVSIRYTLMGQKDGGKVPPDKKTSWGKRETV
jgi:hypothetical protein